MPTTDVPYWPPVITNTWSKIFSVPIAVVVVTVRMVLWIYGIMIWKNACTSVAPSTCAASTMSSGTPLSADDSSTMQKPVDPQIITATRNRLFQGWSVSQDCGSRPNVASMAFSTPICGWPGGA